MPRELPPLLDRAIYELAEAFVCALAKERPEVRKRRVLYLRNVKAHIEARVRRGMEADLVSALRE